MLTEEKQNKFGIEKNIPLNEKFILALGSGLSTLYYVIISNWLLYFYTDVYGINTKYAGTMMSIIRIISAIVLFGFGLLIDKNNSKWGRYKPWVVISWFLIGISGYLLFRPTSGDVITYITITFFIFTISSSINSISGSGFGLTITKRSEDRIQISLFSYISILLFSIISYVLFLPLVNILGNGNFSYGVYKLMFIVMILTFIHAIIIFIFLNERFLFLSGKTPNNSSFFQIFKIILKNKYILISIIYNFSLQLFTLTKMSVTAYYFKYFFKDINMMIVSGAISLIPNIIAAFLSPKITKKIGLRKVIFLSISVNVITTMFLYFVPSTFNGKIMFYTLSTLGGFFLGLCQPAQGIMMPIAADYNEWKYRVNIGGFLGSLNNFVQIIATATVNIIVGFVLSYFRYTPNITQFDFALKGIKLLISIIPAIAFLIGFVVLFWDISEEKHKKMVSDMQNFYS